MTLFSSEFMDNLKKAIMALYDRDKRLNLNGENFWIIEKDIIDRLDHLSYKDLTKQLSHTLLVNLPHTIPFQLRAKVFQYLISTQREEYSMYTQQVIIRRHNIYHDAFQKIY
mmetsp:Transcript_42301/g.64872  ORF Transcript_42301/g.64872 Transcript_42301/m.64872 type:complete len:112 (-) Transcript_42301:1073-1408(-)